MHSFRSAALVVSETKNDSERAADHVDAGAREARPDVIKLGPQGDMLVQAQIHSAADAVSKAITGPGAAESAQRTTRSTDQHLSKGSHMTGIAIGKSRASHVRVGVECDAALTFVISADVPNQPEPTIEIACEGNAGAVLIHSVFHAEAQIGITGRDFGGRGVLRPGTGC